MALSAAQLDRACGALLGTAAGDALGAGYEFGVAVPGPEGPQMIGGGLGGFAPGEWTDDTAMTWCIASVAATGVDLRTDAALTEIARNFRSWFESGPGDMGMHTTRILYDAGRDPTGASMTATSFDVHRQTGHTAGNGSLMRTAAVVPAHLDDADALAEAARRVGALTHYDPRAQEACVLWSLAIRHAVLTGEMDAHVGLGHVDASFWEPLLRAAEAEDPATFTPNGWAITALQAAWSAIVHSDGTLRDGLARAIAIGNDTDTVAAIAGGLLGARWGASAVPAEWRRILHGYPGITGEQLAALAFVAANPGPGEHGWPLTERIAYDFPAYRVPHPHDADVWLGDASNLDALPPGVTAVVSLCTLGTRQVPDVVHVPFHLVDTDALDNPNADLVIDDAARTIAALRAEGHTVLVHCAAGQSRTPVVAMRYAHLLGVDPARAESDVVAALPKVNLNPAFMRSLERLASGSA